MDSHVFIIFEAKTDVNETKDQRIIQKIGWFCFLFSKPNIDMSQQAVYVAIIPNSAVGNRGAKDNSNYGALLYVGTCLAH
jgi:hypothetical protein